MPKKNPSMEMVKCYEITPCDDYHFDCLVVRAGDTWKPAIDAVEHVLESQFLKAEDEGTPWTEIKVEVKCIEMSEEDISEIEHQDD